MKTFKQYLKETLKPKVPKNVLKSWTSQSVDIEKAIGLLNTHCKDGLKAITNGGVLYRGFTDKLPSNIQVMDSSTGERMSRDTNNIYQLMMNASTALADYPSRSKSFICLSSPTSSYGERYIVIPYDGTKVAVLNKDDMFDITVDGGLIRGSIGHIAGRISRILNFFDIQPNIQNALKYRYGQSIAELDEALSKFSPKALTIAYEINVNAIGCTKEIMDILGQMDFSRPYHHLVNAKHFKQALDYYDTHDFNSSKQFFDIVNADPKHKFTAISSYLFTPTTMGIQLKDYGDPLSSYKECWFSGKAIVMTPKLWAGILTELIEQKYPIHPNVLEDARRELAAVEADKIKGQDITYESVNKKVFKYGFRQKKNILGDKYTLIASSGWVDKSGDDSEEFKIIAKDDIGKEIGWVTFKKLNDKLEAFDLLILPMHRRKGVATEMYKFARELGNDIVQSSLQTELGKKFWSQKDHSK